MLLSRSIQFVIVILLGLSVTACGDPTDSPEDCTANEFFDNGTELCRTCPALSPPDCAGDCGFFISADEDRGCPIATCLVPDGSGDCGCPGDVEACAQTCGPDEIYDARSFSCVTCDQSCEGELVVVDGACACRS